MQPTEPDAEVAREIAHDREPHPRPTDSELEREDVVRHERPLPSDDDVPRPPRKRGWRFWRRGA